MRIKALLITLLCTIPFTQNPKPEGWEIFSKVKFFPKYYEEIGIELITPEFDEALKALEGKDITLSGFYIPMELDSFIMISALPFNSCFFCGGAGPETVAEIQMQSIPKNLDPDTFVKVKGKLKLNDEDISHLNFILEDSEIIKDNE